MDALASDEQWRAMTQVPEDQRHQAWLEYNSKASERSYARGGEYATRFRGDVMALYDALRERVGELEEEPEGVPILLKYGSLAGPDAIGDAADYLDKMARRLK